MSIRQKLSGLISRRINCSAFQPGTDISVVSAFSHGDLTDKHWTLYFRFTLTSSPRCAVVFFFFSPPFVSVLLILWSTQSPSWDPDLAAPEMNLCLITFEETVFSRVGCVDFGPASAGRGGKRG